MNDLSAHVQFDEWTKERVPFAIGTNAGSQPLAFQNWRRFKEAFAPELVLRAVAETGERLGRPVRNCLDPCAGSGTTPLACQFLGVDPIAIEVNPFLADLIEAKLTSVDPALVARRCGEVLGTQTQVDPGVYYSAAPPSFVEPGLSGRYLFERDVAERLATLVEATFRVPEPSVRRLLRVLLGTAALDVCNATVSGKGRRYRRNWSSTIRRPADLDAALLRSVNGAVFDIARYSRRKTLDFDLRRADARAEIENIPDIDLAIFSPPYPNSFDYTDVYNIELWALRYLSCGADNRDLRNATLRSHVQIKRDFSASTTSAIAQKVSESLKAQSTLWNPHIPDMLVAYFDDLATLLRGIRKRLCPLGRTYMIVGDSRYGGIDVPVADALIEMAPHLEFSVVSVEPFRSMRASPQQGGRHELAESLLTLEAA